jgi:7-cyano-7-deazaguanine synthase in queuosine biosynthesis
MNPNTPEEIKKVMERVKKAQINYFPNIKRIDDILLAERGFIANKPTNEDIVVLYSGGLDSTIMIQKSVEDWRVRVHPLYIRRGASAEKYEEAAFDYFINFFRERFPDNIGEISKLDCQIPPPTFKKDFPWELAQSIGHPLRNSTMQNIAIMYSVALNGKYNLNIRTVLSASTKDDDAEPEQGLLSLRSQTLNTCISLGDWKWQITSPFTDEELIDKPWGKSDLIKYALEKKIPLEKTRSCFSESEIPDGTCVACYKRINAFNSIQMLDPLQYQNDKYIKVNDGKK